MSEEPQPQEEEGSARTAAFWGLCVANVLALALVILAVSLALRRGPGGPVPPAEPGSAEVEPDPAPAALVVAEQEADRSVNLVPATARLAGQAALSQAAGSDVLLGWQADDTAQWRFKIFKPGVFRVQVDYAAADGWAGGRYQIALPGHEKTTECEVRSSGGAEQFRRDEQPMIAIETSGEHVLELKALQLAGEQLMVLRAIRLEMVQE